MNLDYGTQLYEMSDSSSAGSSHKGKKIMSYTFAFKLKVVAFAESHNNSEAAKTFSVHRKRVIEWRGQKELLQSKDGLLSRKRLAGSGRKVHYPDIEEELLQWLKRRREAGARVTGTGLKKECLRLHHLKGQQNFKASCGWLRKFLRRHNLSFRRATHVGQKKESVLSDKANHFLRFVIRMRQRHHYKMTHIGNMDETPIWMDMPGDYTIETVGTKTIDMKTTGHEKFRITVILGAMADGTKKKPLVILKGVRPPKNIPNGLLVHMHQKAWANEEIILYWLRNVWGKDNQKRRLLVWDAFSAHITPSVKEAARTSYNSDIAVIPGGCTHKLQPCDVSWNRPFKDAFRNRYDDWLVDGEVSLTPKGNRRPPSKELILKWVKESWDEVSPDVVRKSFKVTGISNELDGTEDDLLGGDSDGEDPFEGFSAGAGEAATQANENIEQEEIDSREYSDISSEEDLDNSDTDKSEYDNPDSPAH